MMLVLTACQTENSKMDPEGNTSELFVIAGDSRDSSEMVYLSSVTIFKGTDTLKTAASEFPSYYLWLGKFEKGSYTLSYRNIFDQPVSQVVKATGAAIDTLVVYVDKADYTDVVCRAKIDRLKEGEHFTICYTSTGCGHFERDSLTIYNVKGSLIAYNKFKAVLLSNKQVEAIREFEYQATLIKGGGCTTVDSYQIKFKKEVSKCADGSCRWEGFKMLTKRLFKRST